MTNDKENNEFLIQYYAKINSLYEMWMGTQHKALDWALGLSAVVVSVLLSSNLFPSFWSAMTLIVLLLILSAIYKRAIIAHFHLRNYLDLTKKSERTFFLNKNDALIEGLFTEIENVDLKHNLKGSLKEYMKNVLLLGFLPIFITILSLLIYNFVVTTLVFIQLDQWYYILIMYLLYFISIIMILIFDIRYLRTNYGKKI